MTYRERRIAKAERLTEWAAKREAKASEAFSRASAIADTIPLGQPILVDHYSARRMRRDRGRIESSMAKGHEHAGKAADFTSRAANIEAQAERAIYSDDDDAIIKLQERIAGLEAERDAIKAYNASCRKGEPNRDLLSPEQVASLELCLKYQAYACKAGAFPSYALSNLNGNISKQRARLAQLDPK